MIDRVTLGNLDCAVKLKGAQLLHIRRARMLPLRQELKTLGRAAIPKPIVSKDLDIFSFALVVSDAVSLSLVSSYEAIVFYTKTFTFRSVST